MFGLNYLSSFSIVVTEDQNTFHAQFMLKTKKSQRLHILCLATVCTFIHFNHLQTDEDGWLQESLSLQPQMQITKHHTNQPTPAFHSQEPQSGEDWTGSLHHRHPEPHNRLPSSRFSYHPMNSSYRCFHTINPVGTNGSLNYPSTLRSASCYY